MYCILYACFVDHTYSILTHIGMLCDHKDTEGPVSDPPTDSLLTGCILCSVTGAPSLTP